jgi:hypothetical protein
VNTLSAAARDGRSSLASAVLEIAGFSVLTARPVLAGRGREDLSLLGGQTPRRGGPADTAAGKQGLARPRGGLDLLPSRGGANEWGTGPGNFPNRRSAPVRPRSILLGAAFLTRPQSSFSPRCAKSRNCGVRDETLLRLLRGASRRGLRSRYVEGERVQEHLQGVRPRQGAPVLPASRGSGISDCASAREHLMVAPRAGLDAMAKLPERGSAPGSLLQAPQLPAIDPLVIVSGGKEKR